MSVIKQYQDFKASLRGFAEIPFDEFRKNILPMRTARVWRPDMTEYATDLLTAGAGCALQRLCGVKHPAACRVLGDAELKADPMTKAKLDDHMRALTKSCLLDGWSPEQFIAFVVYLEGGMSPQQMALREREAFRQKALEAGASPGEAGAPGEDAEDGEAPLKKDRFAEMYRAASPAFKRAVKEHLALAAVLAQPKL